MCLGGHLAYRCALDERVKAAVCFFATDIHSKTLGEGKNDDSLQRARDIKGELVMVGYLLRPRNSMRYVVRGSSNETNICFRYLAKMTRMYPQQAET